MAIIWSAYQEAIFTAILTILSSGRDLVVLARAGTGKTTTILEAVVRFCHAEPTAQVLLCAFNVKIAKELERQLGAAKLGWKQAEAKTLHSVGLAAIRRARGKGVRVEPDKGKKIAKQFAAGYRGAPIDGLWGKVVKLADLAKGLLIDPEHLPGLVATATRYHVADQDEVATIARLAGQAMLASAEDQSQVDFGDQIWLPYYLDFRPWPRSLVIVDEAQDMNPAQLWLARASVRKGGRLVAVGDDRQAIYAWRGADSNFISRMVTELGAATLPLPVTYRCGTRIVDEAKQIVPDYEAGPHNPPGVVRSASLNLGAVEPGDFILSRVNAPLLGLALQLLANGVPAAIQGRDIMQGLLRLVTRSKADATVDLLCWLNQYEPTETAKLQAADADDSIIDQLHDQCECLRVLAPEHKLVRDLVAALERLFSDGDDLSRVTLSTVHRAKGLERDRVWLLTSTFRRSGGEEDNIRYVAITRAKNELIYCS